MKTLRSFAGTGRSLLFLFCTILLITGCGTDGTYQPLPPGVQTPNQARTDKLHVGDPITISYASSLGSDMLIQPHKESIKEDGTITPPFVGPVVAAGKTPGQLQKDLQEKYDKLYQNITVTVTAPNRFYYVLGEVRKPGPEPYLGQTDIVMAISAAGGFTDFANKKNVRITRTDGHTEEINVQRAIDDSQYNVPVRPGDVVVVKRSIFF